MFPYRDSSESFRNRGATAMDARDRIALALAAAGLALAAAAALASETIAYRYDAPGRLVGVDHKGGVNANVTTGYSYDKAGNRISRNTPGVPRPAPDRSRAPIRRRRDWRQEMNPNPLRAGALSCALLATTCLAAPAMAQTNQSAEPAFRAVDDNGVDLIDGSYPLTLTEGTIGSG